MYEQYWGLKEKLFENTPDHRFPYQTAQHREALAWLLYAVREGKGAAMLLIAQAVVILLLITILENVSRVRQETVTQ